MKNRFKWLLAYTAVFAVCAAGVFWGCWSSSVAPVMPDCPAQFPPWWGEEAWSLFLADGKFAPWDVTKFFGSPWWRVELNFCASMFFSGLALAYFLLGRRLAPLAAYGAGLLLAFCGYWSTLFSAGHLGWFQYITYGLFAFGLIDRALEGGRPVHWILLGAAIGWGSYYQADLWLLFTAFEGVYFIVVVANRLRHAEDCAAMAKAIFRGGAFALVALVLIGLPGFYSAFNGALAQRDEQIAQSQPDHSATEDSSAADEQRWRFVTNWSMPPEDTLEFVWPRVHGDTSCQLVNAIGSRYNTGVRPYTGRLGSPDDRHGNYRQHSLYVGLVTVIFALLGLRCRGARFFAIAAAVCWLFSLGRYCESVYRLIYLLPFGDYLRAPVKWHHLTEFCICVLAGFGLDFLWTKCRGSMLRWLLGVLVLIGVIDLVRIDSLYCAPVDFSEARRQSLQMTMVPIERRAFANPQVQQLMAQHRLVSVAQLSSDTYLVGVLQPFPAPRPRPPFSLPTALGIVAVVASLGVLVIGVRYGLSRLR